MQAPCVALTYGGQVHPTLNFNRLCNRYEAAVTNSDLDVMKAIRMQALMRDCIVCAAAIHIQHDRLP